ncbi:DUF2760 domain-containing protein [Pendulispora rubella]|uniref:DUF2760 domain-containing protein n=1 Tax=Pendulispora rubella TaxID=2741070 RepID=A0ABZ2LI40_9BACT
MSESTDLAPLSFFTRLWFAWIAFFRVLFDGEFAARAWDAREPRALPPAPPPPKEIAPPPAKEPEPAEKSVDGALQLLGLFQREGRLVDFLTQEIAPFADAEIGATARVIHEGCRKALLSHATIVPLRSEDEDTTVTLNTGFDPAEVKLTGNVKGSGPYRGVLRHRGWRAKEITLPAAVSGHDASILCPAEVEL